MPDSLSVSYNKRSALLHIRRLREILSFHLFNFSNSPSPSLFSYFTPPEDEDAEDKEEEDSGPLRRKKLGQQRGKGKKGGADVDKDDHPVNPLFQLKTDNEEIAEIENLSLAQFYPKAAEASPPCVRSIEFSGWNPPPGNRSLLGDLYYLEVITLEGKTLHITCWAGGFYINRSTATSFDPSPAPRQPRSHHLSGLLAQVWTY